MSRRKESPRSFRRSMPTQACSKRCSVKPLKLFPIRRIYFTTFATAMIVSPIPIYRCWNLNYYIRNTFSRFFCLTIFYMSQKMQIRIKILSDLNYSFIFHNSNFMQNEIPIYNFKNIFSNNINLSFIKRYRDINI